MPGDADIERIKKLRFIGYQQARDHLEDLEDVLATPKRPRMPNRLIVAPSGNGKTMLISAFIRRHPPSDNRRGDASHIPIVCVQVDGPNERQFYESILDALRAPGASGESARLSLVPVAVKGMQAIRLLRTVDAKMLIIDEFHNLLGGPASKQSHFRNVVKRLSNILQIPIVAVGTSLAYNALQADDQLSNRFYPLVLSKWKDDAALRQLLLGVKMSWLVDFDENLIAREVLERTDRTIGGIMELLERAAIFEIRQNGRAVITKSSIADCKYISPKDRGHVPV